jgi:hypothetical protein
MIGHSRGLGMLKDTRLSEILRNELKAAQSVGTIKIANRLFGN